QPLPAIGREDMPDDLIEPRAAPDSRFRWQVASVQATRAAFDGRPRAGFFGVMTAQTGFGKTRAAPAVIAALPGPFRVNVALGLRSLTLQTRDAWVARSGLGIPAEQVAMAMGPPFPHAPLAVDEAEAGTADLGTAADAPDYAAPVVAGRAGAEDLPAPIRDYRAGQRERLTRMLATPALICTIDTLMPAAHPLRGGHLAAMMRLASADLIVDEIDLYDESDLVAVARMVHLAGCFGRRVLIASATVGPVAVRAMRDAYLSGWRVHAALHGLDATDVVHGFYGDAPNAVLAASEPGAEGRDALLRRAYDALVAGIDGAPVTRRVGVLDVSDRADRKAFNQRLFEGCLDLHRRNRVIDPRTGRGVSIGIVRWANIGPCRQFAKLLFNREPTPGGPIVKVVCYHGRMLVAARWRVEQVLDRLLLRKGDVDPLPSQAEIRAVLDDGGTDDLMVIVAATPVEEVGRDHDYDWALIEPSSTRSIAQMAGRIRRHRHGPWSEPNILLFSRPIRGFESKQGEVYVHPGVETKAFKAPNHPRSVYRLPSIDIARLQDCATWAERFDARHCVLETDLPPMPELERRKLRDHLETGFGLGLSVADWCEGGWRQKLASWHPVARRFRSGDQDDTLLWRHDARHAGTGAGIWMKQKLRPPGDPVTESVFNLELGRGGILVDLSSNALTTLVGDAFAELGDKEFDKVLFSCALRDRGKTLEWNEQIGFGWRD
ncbi:MAG: hypothetical protein HQL39_04185, partial [Alphaproteobacteria bacterium]|nr:hypothetical protein [Alphaproteobacteria bacterium]